MTTEENFENQEGADLTKNIEPTELTVIEGQRSLAHGEIYFENTSGIKAKAC